MALRLPQARNADRVRRDGGELGDVAVAREEVPDAVQKQLHQTNGSSSATAVAASTPRASASTSEATSCGGVTLTEAGASRRSASTTSAPRSASARSNDRTGS